MKIRAVVGLGVLVLALTGLAGCTGSEGLPGATICVPRIHIDPKEASAGMTIVVSSTDTCDIAAPKGGWVVVASRVGAGETPLAQTTTSQSFDGSFRVELAIPAGSPAGDAWAGITNWDYSACADNGSCAAAMTEFTIR